MPFFKPCFAVHKVLDLSEWFHIYQQLRFNNVMAGSQFSAQFSFWKNALFAIWQSTQRYSKKLFSCGFYWDPSQRSTDFLLSRNITTKVYVFLFWRENSNAKQKCEKNCTPAIEIVLWRVYECCIVILAGFCPILVHNCEKVRGRWRVIR